MRHPQVISSVEEDFRAIGLLPPLSETDDPTKPRDIPSPDPDTLAGLDNSEGGQSAPTASAKQPKPKMGPPPDDSDAMDPDEDGGSMGAQKKAKGEELKVQGSKEASLRAESAQYTVTSKQPALRAKGKNKGEKPELARGLRPVKKLAGMVKEGRFQTAAALIEEVQGLLHSVQIDEEIDQIMTGFRLVAEDASLLADRFTEVSDRYKVESFIQEMEELSVDAVEALEAMEAEIADIDGGSDEDEAVKNSSDVYEASDKKNGLSEPDIDSDEVYDVPSPAFKEQSELILQLMTKKLMNVVEAYGAVQDHMAAEDEGADEDGDAEPEDNRHEIHIHSKAKKLHIHHDADGDDDDAPPAHHAAAHDGEDDGGGDDEMSADGDDPDSDMDQDVDAADSDDSDADHGDQDQDDDDSGDSDHDTNSLMNRMKALRHRREGMAGGRPFQRGQ